MEFKSLQERIQNKDKTDANNKTISYMKTDAKFSTIHSLSTKVRQKPFKTTPNHRLKGSSFHVFFISFTAFRLRMRIPDTEVLTLIRKKLQKND